MQFINKKESKLIVPIVSLIDILAILLIFFIVTTTFKKKKPLLQIALPKSTTLQTTTEADSRSTLSVTTEGEIYLESEQTTIEALPNQLLALKTKNPAVKLELKADEETSLGILVKIWDALTKADIDVNDVPARILVNPTE